MTALIEDREAAAPLIELDRMAKRYGEITALAEVTATVSGKIIGLLGPNGAGKSTLLKCLLGLLPYAGQARVLGLDAAARGAEIRDRVGYMPEQEAFLSGMSAVELCSYAGELSGLPRSEAMQRAHAALYYAGLEEKRYQPIDGYSTGMKQRVKLAQALVHDPEILFLDEPTNGLDPRSRDEMLELIVELPARRGCAIVLSTHLLPDVERVCDHAVIMHRGAVRFVGTIDELRGARGRDSELVIEVKAEAARLAEALTAAGATCRLTSPIALEVDLPASAPPLLVFRTAHAAGLQIRELGVRRESVEAAFLRVIGADGAPANHPGRAHGAPR
jgi:ABC-2 type transport system ATP-binding protein